MATSQQALGDLSNSEKSCKTTPCKVSFSRNQPHTGVLGFGWLKPILRGTHLKRGSDPFCGDVQMAARETKQHKEKKALHKVTAAERSAVDKHFARREAKPSVRLKVSKNGSVPQIELDHPDKPIGQALLGESLASADGDFVNGIVSQLASASGRGREIDEHGLNFMLSVIKGIEPRDQLEAMLAAQMAAVHVASMTFARRLAQVENIPQQDSAERAFNKLTRTFAMQMEALKRYRSGVEQKVSVQHVSVADGGQAIVGNVTQAPRENGQEKAAAPPPALTDTNVVPMPTLDKSKEHDPLPARRKSNK